MATMNELAAALAISIISRFDSDDEFRAAVLASPEPYRAMIHECGLFEDVDNFDGTKAYHILVDELESALCPPEKEDED